MTQAMHEITASVDRSIYSSLGPLVGNSAKYNSRSVKANESNNSVERISYSN